jgi:hypothetical protein
MAEESGCIRVVVALVSALFWTVITLFGVRFLMDGPVADFIRSRGGSYPINAGAFTSISLALIVFIFSFWAFVRTKKEPEPTFVPKPAPEPIRYGYVCDDCKKGVDREARVCPFCQARFVGGHRTNHPRQRYERLTEKRS